jgi:hypothetical protein
MGHEATADDALVAFASSASIRANANSMTVSVEVVIGWP